MSTSATPRTSVSLPAVLVVAVTAALIISGVQPYDRVTWLMKTFWVVIGVPLAVYRAAASPSPRCCVLLALHALILSLGGHYTYARVPLGEWLKDGFDLARHPYDRIGHFVQGFVPAILVPEILVRRSPLRGSRRPAPLTVCGCLAFSAFFEMTEWWAAAAGLRRGRLPRHPGRRVGHAVGHVPRPRRRHHGAAPPQQAPRPATRRPRSATSRHVRRLGTA